MAQGFWWVMTVACLVWYLTITVYVGIRGVADIRAMLTGLARRDAARSDRDREGRK